MSKNFSYFTTKICELLVNGMKNGDRIIVKKRVRIFMGKIQVGMRFALSHGAGALLLRGTGQGQINPDQITRPCVGVFHRLR